MAPAGTAIKDQIKIIVPQIEEIMEACKEKTAGIMQPSVDWIVKLSLESDLAVKRNILPRNCGIHPENRARSGVDPLKAQNLILEISKQGYSETRLENPMGFEKALEVDPPDEQQKFNEQNFAEAAGYLSVTCSHTFAAVNIIEGGGPGLHEELCNEEGNIDKSKVLQLCPSLQKPMSGGIPCIVFKRELPVACPDLPAFLSEAGNQSTFLRKRKCNSWP